MPENKFKIRGKQLTVLASIFSLLLLLTLPYVPARLVKILSLEPRLAFSLAASTFVVVIAGLLVFILKDIEEPQV